MTIAWYGHLKMQSMGIGKDWPRCDPFSWGIALMEYCFMVPANKMGFIGNGGPFFLMQLKVLQEVITLTVFTVLAMFFFFRRKVHWNHIAASVCLVAAVPISCSCPQMNLIYDHPRLFFDGRPIQGHTDAAYRAFHAQVYGDADATSHLSSVRKKAHRATATSMMPSAR